MNEFLKQVARHYASGENLGDILFVFPNRRATVFFSKYLREALAGASKPVLLPRLVTEMEFFSALYGGEASDKVSLLLELYEVYRKTVAKPETLDEFIFWGDVIIADFSDIDKYLVDPGRILTNVADLRNIQDSFSYLSEQQRKAVDDFLGHFRDSRGLKFHEGDVKSRFLGLWNHLLPIYEGFRERLSSRGMAFDGMIYRGVAEKLTSGTSSAGELLEEAFEGTSRVVFVGLNALNECERKVLGRLRDGGLAEFCWDYCGRMLRDKANRSSFFMDRNVAEFPMRWKLEDVPDAPGEVCVVSIPSSVGQAKLLPRLVGNPESTAVVLPDESLLRPVLNSLRPDIRKINVTMGLGLASSRFNSFMEDVMALQLHSRRIRSELCFYHKQVWGILRSGILEGMLPDEDKQRIGQIKAEGKYYVPLGDFSGLEGVCAAIFRDAGLEAEGPEGPRRFGNYLKEVVLALAPRLSESVNLVSETEFAMRWYSCVTRLAEKDLALSPSSYAKLLGRLLATQSVPFEGEPVGGLQIMGPLETRALDFTDVIILSCNEGTFPRRSVSASLIPPALRTGFGLPTYEFQDSIWAYYFYRLISRSSRVVLMYDSRTEGGKAGEESRYIKQLQYHFRVPVKRVTVSGETVVKYDDVDIEKPSDMARRLKEITLSASSLNAYLSCQAKFYYSVVEKLRPETEIVDSLDAGMIGNVYHEVMEALYLGPVACDPSFDMDRKNVGRAIKSGQLKPLRTITSAYIKGLLGKEGRKLVEARIEASIKAVLRSPVVSGRNLVFADIIGAYVARTLEADLALAPFDILGLEVEGKWEFEGYRFFGYIDRIDRVGEIVRIVDYKTGSDDPKDILVEDPENLAERIFGDDSSKRPKIALQLFLYDMFVQSSGFRTSEARLFNCMYPVPKLGKGGVAQTQVSAAFWDIVKEKLSALLSEMADPAIPFRRTEDTKQCGYCDFRTICGR